MSISSVGSTTGVNQADRREVRHQAAQDFEQLFQALQQGNIAGAQQAYSGLQQLVPAGSADSDATGTQKSAADLSAGSPLAQAIGDWTALGQDLQSGKLSSAQGDFGKLQQDLMAMHQAHHHHQAASTTDTQSQATASGQATGAAAVKSDIASLDLALKAGDNTSAQSLLAKLEQDLQAAGSGHRHHHQGYSTPPQGAVASYTSTAVQSSSSTASVSVSV